MASEKALIIGWKIAKFVISAALTIPSWLEQRKAEKRELSRKRKVMSDRYLKASKGAGHESK